MILYQGGLVDASSFVPSIIALSSAETESNTMCVGAMATAHARMMIIELRTGDSGAPYTVPMLVDSTAALHINSNDKDTSATSNAAGCTLALNVKMDTCLFTTSTAVNTSSLTQAPKMFHLPKQPTSLLFSKTMPHSSFSEFFTSRNKYRVFLFPREFYQVQEAFAHYISKVSRFTTLVVHSAGKLSTNHIWSCLHMIPYKALGTMVVLYATLVRHRFMLNR
jgi:hypothetical protein